MSHSNDAGLRKNSVQQRSARTGVATAIVVPRLAGCWNIPSKQR